MSKRYDGKDLKSVSVFINQIAASLRESLKLKDVANLLSAQYLKEDYAENILENHLGQVCRGITKESFILISHKSDQNQKKGMLLGYMI